MNCLEIKPQLVDLLYGELLPEDEARVRAHVTLCESCGRELKSLQQTVGWLNELPKQDVRLDMAQLCLRQADQIRLARQRLRWTMAAACAALVVVAGSLSLLLNFDVHASHVVIAWRAAPERGLPASKELPSDKASQPSEIVLADAPTRPTTIYAPREQATWRDAAAYLQRRDELLLRGFDPELATGRDDSHPSPGVQHRPGSYRELREQFLGDDNKLSRRDTSAGTEERLL